MEPIRVYDNPPRDAWPALTARVTRDDAEIDRRPGPVEGGRWNEFRIGVVPPAAETDRGDYRRQPRSEEESFQFKGAVLVAVGLPADQRFGDVEDRMIRRNPPQRRFRQNPAQLFGRAPQKEGGSDHRVEPDHAAVEQIFAQFRPLLRGETDPPPSGDEQNRYLRRVAGKHPEIERGGLVLQPAACLELPQQLLRVRRNHVPVEHPGHHPVRPGVIEVAPPDHLADQRGRRGRMFLLRAAQRRRRQWQRRQ